MEANLSTAQQIFRKAIGNNITLPKQLYPPLRRLSGDRPELREKVSRDAHHLQLIRKRMENEEMTSDEVVKAFAEKKISPEEQIRLEMLENNFRTLMEPVVREFYTGIFVKDIYNDYSIVSADFLNKYGLYRNLGKWDWSRVTNTFMEAITESNVFDKVLQSLARQHPVSQLIALEEKMIPEVASILLSELHDSLFDPVVKADGWIKKNIVEKKHSVKEYKLDMAREMEVAKAKITLENVKDSALPKLFYSYIKGLSLIYQEQQPLGQE